MKSNPPLRMIVPGVLPFDEYVRNRTRWDPQEQCVKLDGMFYEGTELKLFPKVWLQQSAGLHDILVRTHGKDRRGHAIGVDPAEGGDYSCWTVGDHNGFIKQWKMRTPDTTVICNITLDWMRKYNVAPENILFDRGGGGKEHADRMRQWGYNVRTVGFGESVTPERKRGMTKMEHKKLQDEERYQYVNRRAEMYGMLSEAVNPNQITMGSQQQKPYCIPPEMVDLHNQLSVFPKLYDKEGRLYLPPKNKPPGTTNSNVITLVELIGHSPDEADSAVLCYYGIRKRARKVTAGGI